jgi:hypothetical protein
VSIPTPDQVFFPGFTFMLSTVCLLSVGALASHVRFLRRELKAARAARHEVTADNITNIEVEALKSHRGSMFLHGPSGYFSFMRSIGLGLHRIEVEE